MNTTTKTLMAQLAVNPCYYTYEQNNRTMRAFREAGAKTIVVAVAGYRLNVTHLDDTLVSIFPKAISAGRGHVVLLTGDRKPDMTVCNLPYYTDPCGSMRLRESLLVAALAWDIANGDLESYYKTLGVRGNCAICGSTLTDPLSQARGIGPECIRKVNYSEYVQAVQKNTLERG